MPTHLPAAVASDVAETTFESSAATAEWVETALTVVFAAAAVLFVSFLAVVTGLV